MTFTAPSWTLTQLRSAALFTLSYVCPVAGLVAPTYHQGVGSEAQVVTEKPSWGFSFVSPF